MNTIAFAANADGSVIVGAANVTTTTGSSPPVPTRWTSSTGTQILTLGDGSYLHGAALRISLDGNTALASNILVYRWQPATGFVELPGLSVNGALAYPHLSGDGNTVISADHIWNVDTGTQPLTTILTNAGCNFSGWSNLIVTGVDFDGNTFCGYGTDPAGLTEGWYATVPTPAPLLLFGLAGVVRRRR